MEGRMAALERQMEKMEERVARQMEKMEERVARLEGMMRVGQSGMEWRGERDGGGGGVTERLRGELGERMEVLRREVGELRGKVEECDRRGEETRPRGVVGRTDEGGGGGGVETRRRESVGRGRGEGVRRRCVVLTDSNGRAVTSDTIMTHIRGKAKEEWEVQAG